MLTRRRTLAGLSAGAVVLSALVLLVVLVVAGGPAASSSPGPSSSKTVTTLVGTGVPGDGGNGGPANRAELDAPSGVAIDASGDLFVADTDNCRVQAVPAHTGVLFGRRVRAGVSVTLVGGPCGSSHPEPVAVALDRSGDLFVDFATAARVDELVSHGVALGGAHVRVGALVDVAGSGASGFAGDGGPATRAEFELPSAIAVDPSGDLLVADTGNCRLRLVAGSNGIRYGVSVVRGDVYTVAGNGVCGSAGDGGPALGAELWDPGALAVDAAGDVLVADQGNRSVRELVATSGTYFGVPLAANDLGTVAGEGSYGPYLVDGLPALGETGELNFPSGLAFGPDGGFYVSDGPMQVIRFVANAASSVFGTQVSAAAMVTVAGARPSGTLSNETTWVATRMTDPVGLAVTPTGNLVYADAGADVVRELRTR